MNSDEGGGTVRCVMLVDSAGSTSRTYSASPVPMTWCKQWGRGHDSGGHLPLLHQAGDGQIRVLRMGGREMFSMTCIHAKMNQSKVMCLAWHPHRAGLLALEQMRGSLAGWRP